MEKRGGSEYHQPSQGRLRRLVGNFVTRHLARGDDDVLRSRGRLVDAEGYAEIVLARAIDAETALALVEAQHLIHAIDADQAPCLIASGYQVNFDAVTAIVNAWVARNQVPFDSLRSATSMIEDSIEGLSDDGLLEYCLMVRKAQNSLQNYVSSHLNGSA